MAHEITEFKDFKASLAAPGKLLLIWNPSLLPKKIVELYFHLLLEELVPIIRIYDVTDLYFDGKNAHYLYEIAVSYENGHWFVKGLPTNRTYLAELGVYISAAEYFPFFRSNCIHTCEATIHGEQPDYNSAEFTKKVGTSPKWKNHVSTYSYYNAVNMEERND